MYSSTHILRQTWSKCPSPVFRPASQLRVQVTFGVFNLERSRLLHWRGQSLYRQTQHSGQEQKIDCLAQVVTDRQDFRKAFDRRNAEGSEPMQL